uniref:Uncharacterized protein n=1 Tax=Anguilla anguilla TaxID=7936 RepID=A0A0E9T4I1_ANGAN
MLGRQMPLGDQLRLCGSSWRRTPHLYSLGKLRRTIGKLRSTGVLGWHNPTLNRFFGALLNRSILPL